MNNVAQKKIIVEILNDINAQFSPISAGDDDEAIHKLRVRYKKLRALLRELNIATVIPVALKGIYHAAGRVRDLKLYYKHVQISYRGLFPEPYEYLSKLELDIYKFKQELLNAIAAANMEKIKSEIEEAVPKKIKKKQLKSFIAANKSAIKKLADEKRTDENLHAIRKHIKDVMYILEVAEEKKDKKLESIAKKLGDYNDLGRFLAFSEKIGKGKIPAGEKKLLRALRKDWKKVKHKLEQKKEIQDQAITASL